MPFDSEKRNEIMQEIASKLAGDKPEEEVVDDSPEESNVESIESESPEKESTSEKEDKPEGEIKTLSELAEAIGLEPSQLYDLEIKLAETGESVKLGSLKDELQSIKKEHAEFQKAKVELEAERTKYQQQLLEQNKFTSELNDFELQAMVIMAQCQEDYKRIDWDEFEKLDAGKCALEQQKLLNKYTLAQQQYQQAQTQKTQLAQQKQQEYIQQQNTELLRLVPEWTDPAKFNSDVAGIVSWAKSTYNLSDQDLGSVIDSRYRDIIRKAYLYDNLQKSKGSILKSSLKQIAGGSKPIKPSDIQAKKVNSLIQKARRSRNMADQLAAARAIFDNS